jgi:hypothetical protein
MSIKRTHVVLSEQLVKDIDAIVGSRQRSSFLTLAAEEKLMRLRQMKALEAAAGSWKDKDHPELREGAAKWVRKPRRQDQKRFQKTDRPLTGPHSCSTRASSLMPSTASETEENC